MLFLKLIDTLYEIQKIYISCIWQIIILSNARCKLYIIFLHCERVKDIFESRFEYQRIVKIAFNSDLLAYISVFYLLGCAMKAFNASGYIRRYSTYAVRYYRIISN